MHQLIKDYYSIPSPNIDGMLHGVCSIHPDAYLLECGCTQLHWTCFSRGQFDPIAAILPLFNLHTVHPILLRSVVFKLLRHNILPKVGSSMKGVASHHGPLGCKSTGPEQQLHHI
mmetsp:Transcript_133874/g.286317  ORF Transcript_133874/g.286317 Transcript_133874/m.286317 type:complete len:115 (-) Transcript_133874:35-379(-)